ncbi:hypothetical protein [Anaerovibrio sp.]|uniref:hypothetical protein n=1 Tax=Anaerovibrio sp. TaxID=1872532 RepID=UPI003F1715B7
MNYKRLLVAGAALWSFSFCANPISPAEASPYVPENIFRWVQSSARTNYFFNKQQICYETDAEGNVDTNLLVVPVLKTFDDVMINDVVAKRRWNGKSLAGFDDFVGVSEYLVINLAEKKVSVQEIDYLDSTWTAIEVVKTDVEVSLEELSEKSLDARFYDRIIDYALRNQLVLAERTRGDLDEALKAQLAEAQEAYREAHKPDRPEDNE